MEDIKVKNNSKGFNIVFGVLVLILSYLIFKFNEFILMDRIPISYNTSRNLYFIFTIYLLVNFYLIYKRNYKYINFKLFVSILVFIYSATHIYFYRIYKINGGIVDYGLVSNMLWYFVLVIQYLVIKTGYKGLRNRG